MRVNLRLQHFELGLPLALLLQSDLTDKLLELAYHLVDGFGQLTHFVSRRLVIGEAEIKPAQLDLLRILQQFAHRAADAPVYPHGHHR
ncbi:hypothetical protein D3C73_771180 [compost metagenome]